MSEHEQQEGQEGLGAPDGSGGDQAPSTDETTPDDTSLVTPDGTDAPDADAPTDEPDLGNAEVQAQMDKDQERGFVGSRVDPTPNENYSLQTPPDAPTPETDAELEAKAHDAAFGTRLRNVTDSSAETTDHAKT